jgi:hypothetical protein
LPEQQRVCPRCGTALTPSDTEDSEPIEIEVRGSSQSPSSELDTC